MQKNFVMEACEYRRHFLAYHPDYAVMLNIDFDHPDYYTSIDDVFNAFQEMALQVKKPSLHVVTMKTYNVFKQMFQLFIMALALKMTLKHAILKKIRQVRHSMYSFVMSFIVNFIFHYSEITMF